MVDPGFSVLVMTMTSHRLTLDLWLAKDNRFLNPKSSYGRILTAPPCRLIRLFVTFLPSGFSVSFFLWKVNKFMKRARGLATPMKGSSSRPADNVEDCKMKTHNEDKDG